jgi:hypothetical protein
MTRYDDDRPEMPDWWTRENGNCRVPGSEDVRQFSRQAYEATHGRITDLRAWHESPLGALPGSAVTIRVPVMDLKPARRGRGFPENPPRRAYRHPAQFTRETAKAMGQRGGRIGGRLGGLSRSPAKRIAALEREARKRQQR